jgi:type IX secretion system PorP/SprF family membrane protein
MKKMIMILLIVMSFMTVSMGQNYPHYSMFMFNKLLYNPAYAGNKDLTTVNAYGRRQWTGFEGAPVGASITIDGPVGSYMKPFRKVALGLGLNTEKAGVVQNSNIIAYYAYRIKITKDAVLSLGLQGGISAFSANYSDLNPYHQNDPNINYGNNVSNKIMPNVGAGAYFSSKKYYVSLGIPFLLENTYEGETIGYSGVYGRQIRSYYLSGGYVFTMSPVIKLQPQILARYAAGNSQTLPLNADFNLSCFFYDRFMIGATYRTDKSVMGILFFQITDRLCAGYSYDHSMSTIRTYNSGTHELTVGFDFVRDKNKYMNPRFIKLF